MASKSAQGDAGKVDVEELLEHVGKTLDRVKVLYEQFFLGYQKQPPAHLHTDLERKLRELQQMQVRNTGLRYRLATLQQKFGSYNTYWRRTLRQIENGTYVRNLSKLSRRAAQTGEEIPEEILAAMPKRMREQVRRDREAALAVARRRADGRADAQPATDDEITAVVGEAPEVKRHVARGGVHVLTEDDTDLDIDAFFAAVTREDSAGHAAATPATPATPSAPPASSGAPKPAPPVKAPVAAAAPSQRVRPIPVAPGSSQKRAPVAVESMAGPFPRHTPPPVPARPPRARPARPAPPAAPLRPPPGMNEADVNALYATYVKAKQAVGDPAGPGAYGKLLQTINAQAPKIMQQYKAKAVEFSVVVKDNQVVLRARPKT